MTRLDEVITMEQIAERLGVKLETVHRYHSIGHLPAPAFQFSRTPVWLIEDIDRWAKDRKEKHGTATDEAPPGAVRGGEPEGA